MFGKTEAVYVELQVHSPGSEVLQGEGRFRGVSKAGYKTGHYEYLKGATLLIPYPND